MNKTLYPEAMEKLKQEEREWITYKETEMENAKDNYTDYTLKQTAGNMTGADLTRIRVYELLEYLK